MSLLFLILPLSGCSSSGSTPDLHFYYTWVWGLFVLCVAWKNCLCRSIKGGLAFFFFLNTTGMVVQAWNPSISKIEVERSGVSVYLWLHREFKAVHLRSKPLALFFPLCLDFHCSFMGTNLGVCQRSVLLWMTTSLSPGGLGSPHMRFWNMSGPWRPCKSWQTCCGWVDG